MARFYPLFSSSKGNSSFIGTPSAGILIDAGVSFRKLSGAFEQNGLSLEAVKGIFITHSHSDHVKGLKMLTKKTGIPVFGQRETLEELLRDELIAPASEVYEMDGAAFAAGMEITCFDTPHDTARSCGYRIKTSDGRICAVCTDLGYVTETVKENLAGCNLVLLEANYDEKMLSGGPYPYYLKQRIRSDHGHLSNKASAAQAAELIKSGTTRIILGHLSQENNTPQTADKTVSGGLEGFSRNKDYILDVAPVESNGLMAVF
ncbi:MBL fold metallo-hydrolase [Porcipelethomonas sp.]|uniref:MBL fold metallo-hydrolase n=1 Tax=Porcipelethomonas sp. TaxID=2981675 RepID=UPI003EF2582D